MWAGELEAEQTPEVHRWGMLGRHPILGAFTPKPPPLHLYSTEQIHFHVMLSPHWPEHTSVAGCP